MAHENRRRKKLGGKRMGLDQQCKERPQKSYREDNDQKKADGQKFGGLAWHEKHKISTDLVDTAENKEGKI